LQNQYRNRIFVTFCYFIICFGLLSPFSTDRLSAQVIRKSVVSFEASDGLLVNADLYQSRKSHPYIILFHQEQSCRGEFDSIATRFIKMNYNCLAVDLRTGADLGFVNNETAKRAREGGYPVSLLDAAKDMEAAIAFVSGHTGKKIILFGSASSASLALIVGREKENVNAIVAFSPGEYFAPEYGIREVLTNYPKPVFVATTKDEFAYLSDIDGVSGIDKVMFKPTGGEGLRGTRALFKENPTRDEYWLSLLIFFKSLQ